VYLLAELVGPALLMAIYVVAVSADFLVGDLLPSIRERFE
jgi:hypothetical protein